MNNKRVTESLDVGTREAVNDFFDALSKWRDEVASSTERYSETILEKMVAAATPWVGRKRWLRRREVISCKPRRRKHK